MAEHRLPPEVRDPVQRLAASMQGVMIDGRLLTREKVEVRIEAWINNFVQLGVEPELVVRALSAVEMLYDDQILDRCLEIVTELHPEALDQQRVFFAPIGDATESSARIMRGFNFMKGWAPDLPTLLDGPGIKQADRPVIIFVDDFLNSGGQLRKILEIWAGKRPHDGASPTSGRRPLGREGLEVMARARLLFVFRFAMEQGRARAEETLDALGWDGAVRCVGTLDDHVGIFGKPDDLANIRVGGEDLVSNASSVFRGTGCKELTRFLAVCEQAGEALLRQRKPDWSEQKYRDRRLGYGNSAKLFLTQYNVPTCTLTCLWAGGRVEVMGRQVNWKPLVRRREKTIGGVETLRGEGTAPSAEEVSLTQLLKAHPLDRRDGATSPLEVVLWAPLQVPLDEPPCTPWQRVGDDQDSGPQSFMDLLRPEARAALGYLPRGPAGVWTMKPAALGPVNNHLALEVEGAHHRCKVQAATCFTFPGGAAASSLRIRFDAADLDLLSAGTICHVLSRGGDRGGFSSGALVQLSARRDGRLPKTSLDRLLAWIQASIRTDDTPAAALFNPEAGRSPGLSLQSLAFIRERGGLFEPDDGRKDRALGSLASFVRPDQDRASRVAAEACIVYDASAILGLSNKGAVWLCGGTPVINHSYAPEQFFRAYLLLHVLLHTVASSCRAALMAAELPPEQVAWLRRLTRFPWGEACQLPRLSRFAAELATMLDLERMLDRASQLS